MRLTPTAFETFWLNVNVTESCWFYGARERSSYHYINTRTPSGQNQQVPVHRVAFFMAHGAIDDALVIDHLCATKNCVRPSHLEQVSRGENVRRGTEMRFYGLDRGPFASFCKKGHPAKFRVTRTFTKQGIKRSSTVCTECQKEHMALNRQKYKDRDNVRDFGTIYVNRKEMCVLCCANGHKRTRETVTFEKNVMRCKICRLEQSRDGYKKYKQKHNIGPRSPLFCRKGHSLDDDNLVFLKHGRRCKICYKAECTKPRKRKRYKSEANTPRSG